ncbi:alcohol dehydrogenase catalytic domain-containing protein [Lactococcus lactis]|uniref:alcohol dehydrogenase catalytic domain-containing protein n=1 Tax=Lactococcus lactis TaxID=1358 RepID=UPI0020734992|nr:alcohol dehydrogenase catalytic domain-containing protein [Lactococcus lactis]MDN5478621.1 alcohol dehydrogenase catalytic domain-containing protein [Chryseobacterium sp.]MDN6024424.1 alcohol dehydrogenase catalytic domain-containing protein [Lactobacillus sp.]MCM6845791.1 alcohol dehydrogenase catalytic domain-containing protein [Lactococcus lactis]MCT0028423.1 ribitol-5-phosphate dehydrogenase [Lactococcus lactis subsp. lactis]MCT3105147.1 ribitol-5-phosphate dehydrogenase [Lactococcus la
MLNTVYRLVSPKQLEAVIIDEELSSNTVIVRPTYLSICHADQRYYNGSRDASVLRKKLPMALIHEGVGEVIKDFSGKFNQGERVIIVPNIPSEEDPVVAENYLPSSKFRSSGFDGLMQEYVVTTDDRLVRVLDDVPMNVAAYTEMISVAMHSILRLERLMNNDKDIIGIWGDGNLGYITATLVKELFPKSKLYIFGKNADKLNFFSFADETFVVDSIPKDIRISQAFECVGGVGSQYAIDQIINMIRPQGSIAIMGVSEHPIEVNTRLVLEKGLSVSGTSRSGVKDFEKTVQFLSAHPVAKRRFENLVGIEREIHNINDIHKFFEEDLANSWGKAIMNWSI